MASTEDYYNLPNSRRLSQGQIPVSPIVSATPPIPPPKAGSHNTSGQITAQIPLSSLAHTPYDRPPSPIPGQPEDATGPPPPTSSTSFYPAEQSQLSSFHDPGLTVQLPRLPSPFLPEILRSKTTTDLAPILSDPVLLSALASTHPSYAETVAPLNQALETNITLASQVLAVEKHLTNVREQTQQLLLQHTTLSTQWKRKQAEMDQALEPWSPKAMYGRLVSGITEQEATVRAIEESFLEASGTEDYMQSGTGGKASEREIAEWIKRIREGTEILERRRESRARWDEGRVGGWR